MAKVLIGDPAREAWWRRGVIYQIYPRSFQDSNGDGVGDLEGIARRLDYIADLGIDAIWISPIFPSPMADFGYDVANYVDVDPLFGDLAAFDRLVEQAHRRGLKVVLDYVPNHTSDQHPWFVESRSSRDNARRDWYLWVDAGADGGPPNNWVAEFGGPSWTWDATRRQFYYHAFLSEQPDLNWRNPEVVSAMMEVLRFWLRRGVDGFRVDAIHHLFEDAELRDNPPNPGWSPGKSPARRLLRTHTIDLPETHEAIAAMRRTLEEFDGERVLIGEAYLPIERLMAYYGGKLDGFHLPFNFHLIATPWRPDSIISLVEAYEGKLPEGGWPNWVLGNHDRSRLASRIGARQARVAAMLLLTLRGTPTLYQGDEIGMRDGSIPPHRVRDPFEKNVPGLGLGRDPARTPMQWDDGPNAGFSTGEPWLPIPADFIEMNVAEQSSRADSMLSLYRDLLSLRRAHSALSLGDYASLGVTDQAIAYQRAFGSERLTIALNLTGAPAHMRLPAGRVLLSTIGRERGEPIGPDFALAPDEGVIVEEAGANPR